MKKVEIQFQKIEIKAGTRKLEDTWKVEIDPEPIVLFYYPGLWERVWNRILNVFGKGRKYPTHDEMMKISNVLKYD